MILIDSRSGSIDLPKLFPANIVKVIDNLPADIVIPGIGKDGKRVTVGIEHKKISDILQCIVNGRFAGQQLPTMLEGCGEEIWLLIEGEKRRGIKGELQVKGRGKWKGRQKEEVWRTASVGSRKFSYRDFEKWKLTMTTKTVIKIKETQNRIESKEWINTVHEWWEKGWDEHRSNEVTNKSQEGKGGIILIENPVRRLKREIAEKLPGVGHMKAKNTAEKYKSVFDMMIADEREWEEIDGIGEKMAERIVAAIHARE